MLAFAGCGDDTGTSGQLKNDARDMVNDVENGVNDVIDDVLPGDNNGNNAARQRNAGGVSYGQLL